MTGPTPASVLAAIDVGTNSVLLTVAATDPGGLRPLAERAEITRLGRGVDQSRALSEDGIRATLRVLGAYTEEAIGLGVPDAAAIACVATSAARDAHNGAAFLARVRAETGLCPEIIGGEREASLTFLAARLDARLGASAALSTPLAVIDIGGGSTEIAIDLDRPRGRFLASLPIGSVRLHERHGAARAALCADLERALAAVLRAAPETLGIGVAGTWTTLATLALGLSDYDAERVHGHWLAVDAVEALADRLWGLSLSERLLLPGLQPGRADVIPVGALIAARSLRALGLSGARISDRGVRWGLLHERAGF